MAYDSYYGQPIGVSGSFDSTVTFLPDTKFGFYQKLSTRKGGEVTDGDY